MDYKDLREKRAPWAPDTSDSWIQECIERCLEPTGAREDGTPTGTHYFALTFFPKTVQDVMSDERFEYLKLLDDDSIPNLYMLTHRGFGKTTLGLVALTRFLVLRMQKYVLYTSAVYDVAARRTEAVKSMLLSPEIQSIFGKLKPESGEIVGSQFSREAFMLINPDNGRPLSFVEPKGAEQVVNGSLVMLDGETVRPTMIFSDDGQNRKHIFNQEVRDRYENWWFAEVEPTVQVGAVPNTKTHLWNLKQGVRPPYRRIVTDTCKHTDAHIMRLQRLPNWFGRSFPLAEEVGGDYLVRHKIMTQAKLQSIVDRFRNLGKMDEFCQEYCCRPSANEAKHWTTDMFQYFKKDQNFKDAFSFIVVDPARGVGYTSILAVSVIPSKGIFLRRNFMARLQPEEYYQATFDVANDLGIDLVIVEETGLAAVIKSSFHQAASIRGLAGKIRFDWVKSVRSAGVDYGKGPDAIKIARGGATIPLYRQKLVWHAEEMRNGALEGAQIAYPECSLWDAMDTQGYIPEIMERYEIYLDPVESRVMEMNSELDHEYEAAGEYFASGEWCT